MGFQLIGGDVAGGLKAGLGMGVLVKTGKYRDGDESSCESDRALMVEDIEAAAKAILQVSDGING